MPIPNDCAGHTMIFSRTAMYAVEKYPLQEAEPERQGTVMKKILIAGAECAPFAKTGGLADVIGTLPKDLTELGLDVRVILPYHRVIKEKYADQIEHLTDFFITLGWRSQYAGVERLVHDGITYYLIDNEFYFGGPIYKGGEAEGEQYAFFTRAVLEAMERIGFIPDVIHCNDWHTAMIPMLIKTQYQETALKTVKTVFTIHNMMYQGKFPFGFVHDLLDIDPKYYASRYMEAYGSANFMKAALVFADKINTVSPSYAEEIKLTYYAYGMEGILNARGNDVIGILNGIDTREWDPATDKYTKHHFNANDRSGKFENKKALLDQLGMTVDPEVPMIGMVSRLTSQKGFDLVMRVFNEIMQENVSIVLLGSGDPAYESFFRGMEEAYKGRVCSYIGYDNALSHQIYSAADFFLMPSKFEPCGISQMISLRYGTLPIVRETGGLKDTVLPYNKFTKEGNGFTFANYNAHDMLEVIRYALTVFTDTEERNRLITTAMNEDNSFKLSAKKYYDMYMAL